jgi:hypothetical protein
LTPYFDRLLWDERQTEPQPPVNKYRVRLVHYYAHQDAGGRRLQLKGLRWVRWKEYFFRRVETLYTEEGEVTRPPRVYVDLAYTIVKRDRPKDAKVPGTSSTIRQRP